MVVNTGLCVFSEKKIFPGHGISFVRKDGKLLTFIDSKTKSLYNQGKKPAKLTWTKNWRKLNKKEKQTRESRKVKKRTVKIQKAIEGISLHEILKKRNESEAQRKRAREKQKQQVKDRKKAQVAKKGGKANYGGAAQKAVKGNNRKKGSILVFSLHPRTTTQS